MVALLFNIVFEDCNKKRGFEPALRPEIGVLEVSRLQLVGLVHDIVDPGHQHVPHALQLTVVTNNLQVVRGLSLAA